MAGVLCWAVGFLCLPVNVKFKYWPTCLMKKKIVLESEELEKLVMFMVGRHFSTFEGFFFFVFMRHSWVNMDCDLLKPSHRRWNCSEAG